MRRIVHLCWVIALAFSFGLAAAPGHTAPQYVFTDLGTAPGASDSTAVAINNLGQVVIRTNGDQSSFVWIPDKPNGTAGRFWDMGVIQPENFDPEFGKETVAYDINDKGEVVGVSGSAWYYKRARASRPFKTRVGKELRPSSRMRSKDGGTAPFAINNRGVAVGSYEGASTSHAAKWAPNGHDVSLGKLHKGDLDCAALDINDRGGIVGTGRKHAWVLSGTHMRDLGEGSAKAVNNHGVVVGVSQGRACVWIASKRQWLDKSDYRPSAASHDFGNSCANGINDAGQIVGHISVLAARYDPRAALWSGGKAVNLNEVRGIPQGWVLESALAINNKGQIVGQGKLEGSSGLNRAFLLTPVKTASNAQSPSKR